MRYRHATTLIILLFLLAFGLMVWFWLDTLHWSVPTNSTAQDQKPDHMIKNFVSIGIDKRGKKTQLVADQMIYSTHTGVILVKNPHLTQYKADRVHRHIQADSGVLFDDSTKIELSGNVKLVENWIGSNRIAPVISQIIDTPKQSDPTIISEK